MNSTVGEILADTARRFPDKTAIICDDKTVTYRELDSRVNQRAHGFLQTGIVSKRRVAVLLSNSIELVEIYFGDINFDDYTDFWLVTSKGVANSYAEYWVYEKSQGHYLHLGNYPWLSARPASKTLQSYERGGNGGMNYTIKDYIVKDNQLQVTREEIQTHDAASNKTSKQVRVLVDGELKQVKEKKH